jgi:uncharacterized protein
LTPLGVLLTHGAGANAGSPVLRRLDEDLSAAGILVVRHTLAFRVKRPNGPPMRGDDARDREGLAAAAGDLRHQASRVVIGGHSYGGRQCSMLVAEQPAVADGLITLAYPLHPPGKPEQLRTGHFPEIRTPTLAVMGERDEFATVAEMRQAITAIAAPVTLITKTGWGHSLKPSAELSETVRAWLAALPI